MRTVTATYAKNNLYKLIDETAKISEPIHISGKRTNAVLISEEDWRDIQETLYLLSIPKMREKIIKGMKTPIEKCSDTLPYQRKVSVPNAVWLSKSNEQ